ncbi:MAG TPA: cell division protein SepF [Candidatus Ornithomonoglobus merdipullorum]|mgnify:CR=1 FL=1|uniref:Cell division protein SepF n=1 Tax=Candidatus Ornithomonoglobus merdipullorum TaxID=2840895 RepID=A0A9D1M9T9_9FIRM|nr:cell division protein SepF [Candidatus Ornithomonoglobus merdipullorum]
MSFISNARRALGSRSDTEYEDYGYNEEDYDYAEEEKPKRRGFFSLFTKKDRDEYEDVYDDEPESYSERRSYSGYGSREYDRSGSRYSSSYASDRQQRSSYSNDRQQRSSSQSSIRYESSPSDMEVKVLYPKSFDDSADIVKEVKARKITIFDVSEIGSNEEARRVVDYICGAAEGMECPFSRLCPSIFCIAPKGVRLTNTKEKLRR